MRTKNYKETIGNTNSDLPACSKVSQPNTPTRAPGLQQNKTDSGICNV